MKLLPILILAIALSVGVACSLRSTVPPTLVPDVRLLSSGEVIGLVQGMLRQHSDERCRDRANNARFTFSAYYSSSSSAWRVEMKDRGMSLGLWYVYEGSNEIISPVNLIMSPVFC